MLKIPVVGKIVQKAGAKAEQTARMAADGTLGPPGVKLPVHLPTALRRGSLTSGKVAPSAALAAFASPDTNPSSSGKDDASDEKQTRELRCERSQRFHHM